jgi:chromosome partitioning protein
VQLEEAEAKAAYGDRLLQAAVSEEGELWRLHEPLPPPGYTSPIHRSRAKIIIVCNNKGGVGKTTLSAMLAAYFEKEKNKKVLLVDLDYQGSLTAWMLTMAGIQIPPEQSYRLAQANRLLDGTWAKNWHTEVLANNHVNGLFSKTQLIAADYTLTQHETKLMLKFFTAGGKPDIRFNLAEALLSEYVQGKPHSERPNFDIVIIDAPPRLTTAVIGAFAAATHLLVPTVLDPLSAETVGSFLKQAWALRERLNPGLELAGIVGTMTPAQALDNKLKPTEQTALGIIKSSLHEWKGTSHIFKRDIQDRAPIRNAAGRTMACFDDKLIRKMINEFGDELSERIGV